MTGFVSGHAFRRAEPLRKGIGFSRCEGRERARNGGREKMSWVRLKEPCSSSRVDSLGAHTRNAATWERSGGAASPNVVLPAWPTGKQRRL